MAKSIGEGAGEGFDNFAEFAAVVAAFGIALGTLVGEDGTRSLKDGAGDQVSRGNPLEAPCWRRISSSMAWATTGLL